MVTRVRRGNTLAMESADAWGLYAIALDAHALRPQALECYRVVGELQPDFFRPAPPTHEG